MFTIHKHAVKREAVTDEVTLHVREGAKLLTVQEQYGDPTFWFLVDDASRPEPRTYLFYGTGHEVSLHTGEYVGTVQQLGGHLVWHIFEKV